MCGTGGHCGRQGVCPERQKDGVAIEGEMPEGAGVMPKGLCLWAWTSCGRGFCQTFSGDGRQAVGGALGSWERSRSGGGGGGITR